MNQRSTLLVVLIAVALLAAACGSDVGADATTATEPAPGNTAAATEAEPVTTTAPPEDDDSGSQATTPPPPAEDSGTVTWRGETHEITEFLLCETVNPAFEGDFNIQIILPDGTDFGLMGNIDDFSADHQGLRLGEIPNEEKATDLALELDVRNLSGTGQTSEGPIEFSFDC